MMVSNERKNKKKQEVKGPWDAQLIITLTFWPTPLELNYRGPEVVLSRHVSEDQWPKGHVYHIYVQNLKTVIKETQFRKLTSIRILCKIFH